MRAQVSSGNTSTLPTASGLQPSSRASMGQSRRLRSIFERRSCRFASFVFTSTLSRPRKAGCHASTSIDPCSPRTLKVCSGTACRPLAASLRTTSLSVSLPRTGACRPAHDPAKHGLRRLLERSHPHACGLAGLPAHRAPATHKSNPIIPVGRHRKAGMFLPPPPAPPSRVDGPPSGGRLSERLRGAHRGRRRTLEAASRADRAAGPDAAARAGRRGAGIGGGSRS